MPGGENGVFRRRRGRQGKCLPEHQKLYAAGTASGVLKDILFQRHGAGVVPFKLGKHRPSGGGKDQRTVALTARRANEALSGFHLLPGHHQHGAADKVCAYHGAAASSPDAVQRPGGNVGLGLCGGSFHFQPSFGKIQAGP